MASKTFLILFQGERVEDATPLLYCDDPGVVRTVLSVLADRAEGSLAPRHHREARGPAIPPQDEIHTPSDNDSGFSRGADER